MSGTGGAPGGSDALRLPNYLRQSVSTASQGGDANQQSGDQSSSVPSQAQESASSASISGPSSATIPAPGNQASPAVHTVGPSHARFGTSAIADRDALRAEIQALRADLHDQEIRYEFIRGTHDGLHAQFDEEKAVLEQEVDKKTEELKDLEKEHQRLESAFAQEKRELRQELSEAKRELDYLYPENQALTKHVEDAAEILKSEKNTFLQQTERLRNQIEDLQAEKEAFKAEVTSLQKRIDGQPNLEDLHAKWEEEKRKLEHERAQHLESIVELNDELASFRRNQLSFDRETARAETALDRLKCLQGELEELREGRQVMADFAREAVMAFDHLSRHTCRLGHTARRALESAGEEVEFPADSDRQSGLSDEYETDTASSVEDRSITMSAGAGGEGDDSHQTPAPTSEGKRSLTRIQRFLEDIRLTSQTKIPLLRRKC
jgi:predicted  nucleic acid-binding Zn-ribbon protein